MPRRARYHGDRALMSFEVGKRAMDFLIENSGTRRNLEVDFFGGEPLMNFDMVKKLVAYCRAAWRRIHNKNFRFTMTTNGVLIDDDVIDFCNKEMPQRGAESGRPQGGQRPLPRGLRRQRQLRPHRAQVPGVRRRSAATRTTICAAPIPTANTDFTNDIFHMADLGFTELSMEPVVCDPSDPSALTEADLPILKEQYEILAKEMIKRDREGRALHLLPLHDRPDRRPLHL